LNDGVKMSILLFIFSNVFFWGGYFVGAGYGNGELRLVNDALRGEITLGRVRYDKLKEKNGELTELYKSSRETTEQIFGIIESGKTDIERGIGTLREAIEIVRAIKSRDSKIKAIRDSKELDYWGAGSIHYTGVSNRFVGW